jgi:hypothetical protein
MGKFNLLVSEVIGKIGYHFLKKTVDDLIGANPIIKFRREECESSYQKFREYFSSSVLFDSIEKIREYSLKEATSSLLHSQDSSDELFMEFGVFQGTSINQFAKILSLDKKTITGFDSFLGLVEDWAGSSDPKGAFNLGGVPPKTRENVRLVVGKVQETLPKFLEENKNKKIQFVHLDMDTYATTKFILKNIKPYLNEGCILLFDELYNFPGWRVGEYKALMEEFLENEFEYIAFHVSCSVGVRYLGSSNRSG